MKKLNKEKCLPSYEISGFHFLMDVKFLAEKYYLAALKEASENSIVLQFNNGQKFEIKIKELVA